jgi:dihydroorotate dehydrogenase (NAD+) catalytic subunit
MQLGTDKDLVAAIVSGVVGTTRKPVFVKLTPNAANIGEIAKYAVDAGAYGIVAINTVGPGYYSVDGHQVLTFKNGGVSGKGIIPIGLRCVRDIKLAIGDNHPIIGMGGIRNINDINAYSAVGANAFGIGSALAGMNNNKLQNYFSTLVKDNNFSSRNNAEKLLKHVNMNYQKVSILNKLDIADDFKIIQTDGNIFADPGQFVFAWIPDVGEKPFSVMDTDPLTLGVLGIGDFTKKFNSLNVGNEFYVRGPYGQTANVPKDSNVVLVGGGCGIAGLYLHAKKLSHKAEILTLLAAKNRSHIAYLNEFVKYGKIKIATEDGSLGKKGLITDLMDNLKEGSYFFNCGSKGMVNAVLPFELQVSSPERIYSSVDYMTKCGVGICGSCVDKKGVRTCIEGPFMKP